MQIKKKMGHLSLFLNEFKAELYKIVSNELVFILAWVQKNEKYLAHVTQYWLCHKRKILKNVIHFKTCEILWKFQITILRTI